VTELTSLSQARNTCYQQANENGMVKQELALLKPDAKVYKMIGPVLLKQVRACLFSCSREQPRRLLNLMFDFVKLLCTGLGRGESECWQAHRTYTGERLILHYHTSWCPVAT
jgi:Prefoldin subunit